MLVYILDCVLKRSTLHIVFLACCRTGSHLGSHVYYSFFHAVFEKRVHCACTAFFGGSLTVPLLFSFHQGRHVKTGQLAAIKVMDVTGVRRTFTCMQSLTHTRTYPHTAYQLKWLYHRRPCHLIMSDESVLACVRACIAGTCACDVAERKWGQAYCHGNISWRY